MIQHLYITGSAELKLWAWHPLELLVFLCRAESYLEPHGSRIYNLTYELEQIAGILPYLRGPNLLNVRFMLL